eukprot:8691552-Pyramimonas_sp.AAC.1
MVMMTIDWYMWFDFSFHARFCRRIKRPSNLKPSGGAEARQVLRGTVPCKEQAASAAKAGKTMF